MHAFGSAVIVVVRAYMTPPFQGQARRPGGVAARAMLLRSRALSTALRPPSMGVRDAGRALQFGWCATDRGGHADQPDGPEVATPRVVARTAGLLTAMGGLAAMALVLGSPGGLSEMHPFVIGIAPSTTLVGLAVIRWGHLVPRAFFQVLLVVGAVGIGVFAWFSPTVDGAVAVLSLMAFASMDAFLFFPLLVGGGLPGRAAGHRRRRRRAAG